MPPGLAFLLLGLPEARVRKNALTALVLSSLFVFFAITSLNWVAFDRNELSGLEASLAALPQEPRLIGLSFLQKDQ